MTDVSTAATGKEKIERVADRQWVDAGNSEVDIEAATGCRYVDLATKRAFVYQTGLAPGAHATMLAIFGALTKAGNIRNTLINGPKADPNADVIQGIEDWFSLLIDEGTWSADRVGGGIRVNPEILARAIAHVKNEHAADAHTPYLAKILSKAKVTPQGEKKDILYSTFALRNKAVEAKYQELLPAHAAAPSAADL